MKKAIFWTIAIAATIGTLATFSGFVADIGSVQAQVPEAPAPTVIDRTPEKLAELKADVVKRLMECESAGHPESDGIIIFDSNNKASIGRAQFQKATVIHYMKVLHGEDITAKDAVLIALDDKKAATLAEEIIFTTKSGVESDWYNCSNKGHLQAEVDLIKKLESKI